MPSANLQRSIGVILLVSAAPPLLAQGTEKAIAAAVLFGAVAFGSVIAGLVITVLYVCKRRPWQRWVALVFGAVLLLVGLWIGTQPGSNNDIEFLQMLLSGVGGLILLLGSFLPSR